MKIKLRSALKRLRNLPLWGQINNDFKQHFEGEKWRLFKHLFFPILGALLLCGLQFVLYGTLKDMTTTNSIQPNPTNYYDNQLWTIEPTGLLWFFKHLSLTSLISIAVMVIKIYARRLLWRIKRFSLRTAITNWRT